MDSEEEKEQKKGFKVDDRRRFSAEGELKPEHRGPEPAETRPDAPGVNPHTNQPAEDLPAAQQLIDIIAMLENKTRGNLDRDEQSMLEAILFDLRMKYVERARH